MAEIKKTEETLEEARARADRAEQELKQLRREDSAVEPEAEAPTEESMLRTDAMMSHLMDALNEGSDIGHYGRLVFAMVASKFLSEDQVVAWLRKDSDFSEQQATLMLKQVESRDYNPPRRERIL